MTDYFTKDTRVAWIAGKSGTALDIKSFRSHNVDINNVKTGTVNLGANIGGHIEPGSRPTGRHAAVTFSTEFYGSDTTDLPSSLGALYRACGLHEVRTEDGYNYEYAYQMVHAATYMNSDPVDILVHAGGIGQTIDTAAGNAVFNFVAGEVPTIDWTFIGEINSSFAIPIDSTALTAFQAQTTVEPFVSSEFTFASNGSLVLRSCSFDLGNKISLRPDAVQAYGYNAPQHVSSAPKFNCVFEAAAFSTTDPYEAFINETAIAVSFIHENGGGDGHEVLIELEGKIDQEPTFTDDNGMIVWNITLAPITTGTDIFSMTWQSI